MGGDKTDSVLFYILLAYFECNETSAVLIKISSVTNRNFITKLLFRKSVLFKNFYRAFASLALGL